MEDKKPKDEHSERQDVSDEAIEAEYLKGKPKRERKLYLGLCSAGDKLGGPPVDDEKLRKLERDELTEEERHKILNLIATYASWSSRSDQIHSEENRRWNDNIDDSRS